MSYEVNRVWTTEAGLKAVVIMCRGTHHCGYVGVDMQHPLFGCHYMDESANLDGYMDGLMGSPIGKRGILSIFCFHGQASPEMIFDVHGSLTYSGGHGSYPILGDEWWFGFDCAHAGDRLLGELRRMSDYPGILRDERYVRDECESLAKQLAAIKWDWQRICIGGQP